MASEAAEEPAAAASGDATSPASEEKPLVAGFNNHAPSHMEERIQQEKEFIGAKEEYSLQAVLQRKLAQGQISQAEMDHIHSIAADGTTAATAAEQDPVATATPASSAAIPQTTRTASAEDDPVVMAAEEGGRVTPLKMVLSLHELPEKGTPAARVSMATKGTGETKEWADSPIAVAAELFEGITTPRWSQATFGEESEEGRNLTPEPPVLAAEPAVAASPKPPLPPKPSSTALKSSMKRKSSLRRPPEPKPLMIKPMMTHYDVHTTRLRLDSTDSAPSSAGWSPVKRTGSVHFEQPAPPLSRRDSHHDDGFASEEMSPEKQIPIAAYAAREDEEVLEKLEAGVGSKHPSKLLRRQRHKSHAAEGGNKNKPDPKSAMYYSKRIRKKRENLLSERNLVYREDLGEWLGGERHKRSLVDRMPTLMLFLSTSAHVNGNVFGHLCVFVVRLCASVYAHISRALLSPVCLLVQLILADLFSACCSIV